MKRSLCLWLGVCLSGPASLWAADAKRPNILFASPTTGAGTPAPTPRLDGPGTSPNDVVRTPNFDRRGPGRGPVPPSLRHRPVAAPRAAAPCCRASTSCSTGRGAILHGAVWDGIPAAFPLLLRDAGYHIGKTYKVWSPGTPADAPFGGQKFAYEKAGRRFNQFSENVTADGRRGDGLARRPSEPCYDEVGKNFDAFLDARPKDQPFCFWFGPTNVHRKWIKGSGKALWGIDPDALKGKLPPFLPDVPEVREDFADYLGEAQAFDAATSACC